MGKPAARVGDMAGHMGTVLIGSTNVFIGGLPAARKGDALVCPIHGTGVITQGSTTVLINGMPAARMTDLTGCMTFGMSAISIPLLLGPTPTMPGLGLPALPTSPPSTPASTAPQGAPTQTWTANAGTRNDGRSHANTDNVGPGVSAMHAEAVQSDSDNDGTYDTTELAAEGVRMRNAGYRNVGPAELGGTHALDVYYGSIRGTTRAGDRTTGYGLGTSGQAEVGMLRWGVGGSVAQPGSRGRNPSGALAAEANMLRAKAEADVLIGSDGNRIGLAGKAEAEAQVLNGELQGTATTPSIRGYNIQARAKVGASAGSAGVGGGIWLYYDRSEGRLHAGVSARIAALLGLSGDLSFSAGREYQDPNVPPAAPAPAPVPATPPAPGPSNLDFLNTPGFGTGGIPGTVLFGCMNVLIGD